MPYVLVDLFAPHGFDGIDLHPIAFHFNHTLFVGEAVPEDQKSFNVKAGTTFIRNSGF